MLRCFLRTFSLVIVTISCAAAVVSCDDADKAAKKEDATKVSVRIPWIRTSATAGLEVADARGYFAENGIKVEIHPGSVEASPLRKVLTGEDAFGLLEPAQIIAGIANEKMPLVILALKAQKSPFCLMSRKDKAIRGIEDIKGHRVGYNPLNDVSYRAMLLTGGIKREDLKEVRVQFSLEPFLQGQVDVWPSYISNEPVAARMKGIDVALICADDVGVRLYEHALFARKDFVEKNPDTVVKFLRGWIKGWRHALANPDEAVDTVLRRTEGLDRAHEKEVLKIFGSLMTAGRAQEKGLAWVEPAMIQGVIDTLSKLGLIKTSLSAADIVDNRFLAGIDGKPTR